MSVNKMSSIAKKWTYFFPHHLDNIIACSNFKSLTENTILLPVKNSSEKRTFSEMTDSSTNDKFTMEHKKLILILLLHTSIVY